MRSSAIMMERTLAGGDGGLEGQAVDLAVLALNAFQVQVGGDLLAGVLLRPDGGLLHAAGGGAIVRVTDVLPGLLTVQDALLKAVEAGRLLAADGLLLLQGAEDGLLLLLGADVVDLGGADQAAGQDAAVVLGQQLALQLLLVHAAEIVGEDVDDQGAVQDAALALLVQRDQRGDQADISTGRNAREGLSNKTIRFTIGSLLHWNEILCCCYYLDVSEEAGRALALTPLGGKERSTNVLTLGTQRLSGVDVKAVQTGLHAVDHTTDLDGAGDGGLLQHDLAVDIIALDDDNGATGAFDGLGGNASEGDCFTQNHIVHQTNENGMNEIESEKLTEEEGEEFHFYHARTH